MTTHKEINKQINACLSKIGRQLSDAAGERIEVTFGSVFVVYGPTDASVSKACDELRSILTASGRTSTVSESGHDADEDAPTAFYAIVKVSDI